LRKAFADFYSKHFNVSLDPESEILPLIGSKEGIFHISMTYLNPGDEVLVPNPGYPAYSAASNLTGAVSKTYDLTEENGWLPDLNELSKRDLSKVKIMWVNYPNMPTGTNANSSLFHELNAFGKRHEILICNDNPYAFVLNDQPSSILSGGIHEHVLELNSLSKSHNMAGWRIGMIGGHKGHIENILRFKSNLDSGMFYPLQKAAARALELDQSWFDSLNETYTSRRELVYEIMDLISCEYDRNQVGMFVWAKVADDVASVENWLDEIMHGAELFITPGFIFGSNGERYVRISLCSDVDVFNEAIRRLKNYLEK